MTLKVDYFPTEQITTYANNSRTHSARQVEQIAASIQEFGFTNPLLVDEQCQLIAGHGRLEAARLMQLPEVPAITLTGLSESQRRAYVIADNKLAQNAGWNDELLKLEIEALELDGFNTDLLGWDVLPTFSEEIDYSILDEALVDQVDEISKDVKRAIQIEFESEDYEEAAALIRHWRDKGYYVGRILMEALAALEE